MVGLPLLECQTPNFPKEKDTNSSRWKIVTYTADCPDTLNYFQCKSIPYKKNGSTDRD